MYIENYDFKEWMQKLFDKLDELCKDVRALHTTDKVLPEDDNLLDNQDLCLLFKVSIKTLQRYRAIGVLPYFTLSGKVYYRASDVRAFIKERFNAVTLRKFEKEHCAKKKKLNIQAGIVGINCSGSLLLMASLTCPPVTLTVWLARSAALPFPVLPLAFGFGIQNLSRNQSGFG